MTDEVIALNETIHQSTRLRIMTMLVSQPPKGRIAYGFIQKTLRLTGGNLTTHLRKLEDADYLVITKEFLDSKPRTWVQATQAGTPRVRRISLQPGEGAELAAAYLAHTKRLEPPTRVEMPLSIMAGFIPPTSTGGFDVYCVLLMFRWEVAL